MKNELAFEDVLQNPDGQDLLFRCLRRIRTWHVPPSWSRQDWLEEITAHATAAAWQALSDYEESTKIPLLAFLYQRILARALTRYRQEWAYGSRCLTSFTAHALEQVADSVHLAQVQEIDIEQITSFSPIRQWIIHQLFWQERSESAIAKELGITQQAVSKQKRAILLSLSNSLNAKTMAKRL